eukprot:NODE_3285_length_807_cov_257.250000.p2 GENE.NODE_3285_length_807_cov_257.250000~~NODE_3285_length_807_cov_257.250000.p2  ORF type:complete len:248 (-),score=94.25 NODE_3285_length_807_cov_257.250000:62-736(-)
MAYACAGGPPDAAAAEPPLWTLDAHKGGATVVRIASNLRFVLSGGHEGELRLWELKTKKMASSLKEHKARVSDLVLLRGDKYAISASRDRCVLTWDLCYEQRLSIHAMKHGGINAMAVAPDETTLITAGQEHVLTYWDLREPDPVRSIPLDEEVNTLALSPDGRFLATAGTGLSVKIWDVGAAAEVSQAAGHTRPVQKLSFSPDGKQVVSAGLDHSAIVWNFYT